MTEEDIGTILKSYPFMEAKQIINDECERLGIALDGNETIFDLKAKILSFSENSTDGEPLSGSLSPATGRGSGGADPSRDEPHVPDSLFDGIDDGNQPTPVQESDGGDRDSGEGGQGEGVQNGGRDGQEGKQTPQSDQTAPQKRRRRRRTQERQDGNAQDEKREAADGNEGQTHEEENMDEQLKRRIKDLDDLERQKADAQNDIDELKRRIEEERRRKERQMSAPSMANEVLDEVEKRLRCLGKAFLVGPAGTGKSTLAMLACARIFGIESVHDVLKSGKFAQISFSPDTLSCDMIGFTDVHGKYHETDIVRVFREGGVILFDEMDNADASILVKLNTMIANGVIPTPDGVVEKHPDTYFVGTANTYLKGGDSMYVGRSRLDAATIDRWAMAKIEVQYNTALEDAILKQSGIPAPVAVEITDVCRKIRDAISEAAMKMVCSTRFIEDAAKLLKAGYSVPQIVNIYLLGADQAAKRNITKRLRQ